MCMVRTVLGRSSSVPLPAPASHLLLFQGKFKLGHSMPVPIFLSLIYTVQDWYAVSVTLFLKCRTTLRRAFYAKFSYTEYWKNAGNKKPNKYHFIFQTFRCHSFHVFKFQLGLLTVYNIFIQLVYYKESFY